MSVRVWLSFTFDAWEGLFRGALPPWATWGIVVVAAMVVAGWKHRSATLTSFLNVVGVLLCTFALFSAGNAHWAIRGEMARISAKVGSASAFKGERPDIFHVVLDGYGRTDVFERAYGFSDREFVEGLRKRGFYVADDARSNYVQTELSLASMLNLRPVQDLVE